MFDDDDDYDGYHTGGWSDFAGDLVAALAQAGQKQLAPKKPESQAQTQSQPAQQPLTDKGVFDKAVDAVSAVAKKKKEEETVKVLVWVVLGYLIYKEIKRR